MLYVQITILFSQKQVGGGGGGGGCALWKFFGATPSLNIAMVADDIFERFLMHGQTFASDAKMLNKLVWR